MQVKQRSFTSLQFCESKSNSAFCFGLGKFHHLPVVHSLDGRAFQFSKRQSTGLQLLHTDRRFAAMAVPARDRDG